MSIPFALKRIYCQALKHNKLLVMERLSWAFPEETYKIYICSNDFRTIQWWEATLWLAHDEYQSNIEEVYLLRPNETRQVK